LIFAEGCFPVLKNLSLHGFPNLSHLEFQQGSLVHLNTLTLGRCDELTEVPQGIENLIQLGNMELFEMSSDIVEKMQDGETLEGNHEDTRRTIAVKNTRWHSGQLLQNTFYTNLFAVQA
jgi:disease resistance protein RPM1